MQEEQVKFVCPKCGGNVLVRTSVQAEIVEVVDGLRIGASGIPGSKFNVVPGFRSVSDGKPQKFSCQACGYVLRGKVQVSYTTLLGRYSHSPRKIEGAPIKNAKQLHDWFKRKKKEEKELESAEP